MDWDSSRFWLELLKVLGGFAAFCLGWWWSRRRRQTSAYEKLEQKVSSVREDLSDQGVHSKEELSQKLADLRSDLTSLESRVDNLPSHADVGKVYERLSQLEMGVHELMGEVGGMRRSVDTMNSFLLNMDRGGQG